MAAIDDQAFTYMLHRHPDTGPVVLSPQTKARRSEPQGMHIPVGPFHGTLFRVR